MEFWDILDENANPTGRVIERGKPMAQDEYHLVVDVWIRNRNGEYLISKRTPNKPMPNMWETTGGSAIVGDDSIQAALREVREEIGINLPPDKSKRLFRVKRQHRDFPDFVDVWLFEHDTDISQVVYQADEVCDAKWATPQTIRAMIQSGEFASTYTYLDDVLG